LDILFSGVAAVLADEQNTVLDGAYVGVEDGKIVYVGSKAPKKKARRTISGTRKVLMPGLCNAHTHTPMTLLRGYADDYELHTWLNDHIFPAEARMTEDMLYWGTSLAIMEMLAGGTVSFTDMYGPMMEVARATDESGMKANLSRALMHRGDPKEYDFRSDDRAKEARALTDEYHNRDHGRIKTDIAIHGEYTSCFKLWEQVGEYAAGRRIGIHVHLSETRKEHEESKERNYGRTPAQALHAARVFEVPTTAAHCVWVENDDIEILREMGVTAAHNPVSNAKLASGTANVPLMLERGVNVALGTDGMASNNSHDMFEEMKAAALLNKLSRRDPEALNASSVLRMATRNGYIAQGRAKEGGYIKEGCDADLILLDFDKPHLTPCHSVISSIVYAARGSDVCLTMVRGKILYENGEFLTMDAERVLARTREIAGMFAK
jgi:5-methylthioadenosine/S-adenosylhomocysteine deaminase